MFACCSQQKGDIVGVANFDDLLEIAQQIHSTGDQELLLKHADIESIPAQKRKEILATLEQWQGLNPDREIEKIEIQSPDEYDPDEMMPENWPEDFKEKFQPIVWSVKPDKYIVFYERPKRDIEGHRSRWVFGAFNRESLWYFSTGYYK